MLVSEQLFENVQLISLLWVNYAIIYVCIF